MKKHAPRTLADIAKEIATDADKFTITFPQDLKVRCQLETQLQGGWELRRVEYCGELSRRWGKTERNAGMTEVHDAVEDAKVD